MIAIPVTVRGNSLNLQAESARSVSASDTTIYTPSCLYVGTAGDVAVKTAAGDVVTFTAVPAGTFMPVQITQVRSTNTTASNFVLLT